MSFPKIRLGALVITAGVLMSLTGFAPAMAATDTTPQLEATNFVVSQGTCDDHGLRTPTFGFDFTGGPDSWQIDRNPLNDGPTVASGAVATTTGSVTGTMTGQPAGTFEYALYGSRGGQPTAKVTVTIDSCTTGTGETLTAIWLMPEGGSPNHVTWPQALVPAGVPACGTGQYQLDKYPYGSAEEKAKTDKIMSDGILTKGEDYGWVISWSFDTPKNGTECNNPTPTPTPVVTPIPTPTSVVTPIPTPTHKAKPVATPVPVVVTKTRVPAVKTAMGPKVVTDYISDDSNPAIWYSFALIVMGGAVVGFGLLRRKTQKAKI